MRDIEIRQWNHLCKFLGNRLPQSEELEIVFKRDIRLLKQKWADKPFSTFAELLPYFYSEIAGLDPVDNFLTSTKIESIAKIIEFLLLPVPPAGLLSRSRNAELNKQQNARYNRQTIHRLSKISEELKATLLSDDEKKWLGDIYPTFEMALENLNQFFKGLEARTQNELQLKETIKKSVFELIEICGNQNRAMLFVLAMAEDIKAAGYTVNRVSLFSKQKLSNSWDYLPIENWDWSED